MAHSITKGLGLKASYFLIFFALIFLVYQNCAPAPNQDSPTETTPENGVNKSSVGSLDMDRPITLLPASAALILDLNSGEITGSREVSYLGQCLDPEITNDIRNFLTDSSICQTQHQVPEGAMCTMIYKYPYIELFVSNSDSSVKLGEETSGCPEVTMGLCENDEALKALAQSIDPETQIGPCQ